MPDPGALSFALEHLGATSAGKRRDYRFEALPGDASPRSYHRIAGSSPPLLLMQDLPEPQGSMSSFISIARHLLRLGLSAPKIHAEAENQPWALIEDFGDSTYSRLLAGNFSEDTLYSEAILALAHLHDSFDAEGGAALPGLPSYDFSLLMEEADLLIDWYYPRIEGRQLPAPTRRRWTLAWRQAFEALPPATMTLVLRDFHCDNLVRLPRRPGPSACGLLDFQDAVLGHPAYDLMSLVEDARRDIRDDFALSLIELYHRLREGRSGNRDQFGLWFQFLAAQRHAKVLGIFTRLAERDGKSGYLVHLERVARLFERALDAAPLAPVRAWIQRHFPGWRPSSRQS